MLASADAVHHQVAYVTRDLDRAKAEFASAYGVSEFFTFDAHAGGEHGPPIRIALANVGGVEIELIEPGPGAELHAEPLPKDGSFAIKLHHLAIRVSGGVDAWERHRAAIDPARHPIVLEGAVGDGVRFVYTDERARLGHYLEHVWFSPEMLAQMQQLIPRYPAAAS